MQKTAFVTGATGGIGQAIVRRLLLEEYRVIVCGRNGETLTRLYGHDANALCCVFDFRDVPASWIERFRRILEPCQKLDAVVCAHGAPPVIGLARDVSRFQWHDVLEIDVYRPFELLRILLTEGHLQRDSAVTLISSLHAHQTYPGRSAYTTAKAAVCGLMRSLAVEWGPLSIRVNAILPWQVHGARTQQFIDATAEQGEDLLTLYQKKAPLMRLVDSADIAETVLFLSRNASITGQEIVVDCGVSASMWYKAHWAI